jgi:hypothetical protein
MPDRNSLRLVGRRLTRRHERKIKAPVNFPPDWTVSTDQIRGPEAKAALMSELQEHVQGLLADLADDDLGAALLELCELRRLLAEIGPEQYMRMDLE